ncbi:MAG: hypothetical protein A2V93_08010 [Ignavibacteria bacterium RBG_16_34_14]|nr:MAG: hypothetical protein A2V93_08010 [Ignavibacteria bacterium RBG_16_34_14]
MNHLKNTFCHIIFIFVGFFCWSLFAQNSESNRQKLLMDFNWRFQLGDQQGAEQTSNDDNNWRLLNLPHDWSIEGEYNKDEPTGGSGGYLPTGIGWYRKHFQINKEDLDKHIWIEFDGVYMNSDVWINSHHLGRYPYGYSSFFYELTPYLVEGENIIAVRVDNSKQPNTRWYTGSGIYRHVWLVKTYPLHIAHWGIFVTTPYVSQESATVEVKIKVENKDKILRRGKLQNILFDYEGEEVARIENDFSLDEGKSSEINQQLKITSPELWSLEKPNLYKLLSVIYDGDKKIDNVTTDIGIRHIEYDVDKGFFLNGKHVKMNGVCLHHDGGCVGAAVPIGVWERRLKKLKEMGCNAIRTSHNPPAPEFLDLCDKIGILVMDEAFDEWKYGKRKYGYHEYFDEWAEKDLTAMIHRDRNHPSIVMWSVGNEIPEQKDEKGHELLKPLMDICHREDPTRPVTSGLDNIAADGGSTTLDFMNMLDIVGYNYVDRWHQRRELYYSIDRHEHPDWKMIGTESISNSGGIRGEYSFGENSSIHPDINFWMNEKNPLRNESEKFLPSYNFWMINAEQLWKFVRTHDYVIGDFMWTGIDYLGESVWPNKHASFGVLDLCGFPKDGFYFYQSQWTEEPMIHIFPHWNWKGKEGQVIPVVCYTNCNAVELFLNGKSFGEKRLEFPRQGTSGGWNKYEHPQVFPTTADLHLQWDVPYEPGILKAVGKKDGKIVYTKEIKTAEEPAALRLIIDDDTLTANAQDIVHIEVQIVDADGNIVPTANNLVKFIIEGKGKIIGVDNGNPQDHNSYKINQRNAFNGLCLAIIQSTDEPGKIKLIVKSYGLKEASVDINSIKRKY